MASSYPGAIDTYQLPQATDNLDTTGVFHDLVHDNEINSILAVQNTLGINPQGGFASVVARMNANDTSVSDRVRRTGGGLEAINLINASGSATTLDITNYNAFRVILTANCTFTFAGFTNNVLCSFTVILLQDGTGGRTVTWPASVHMAAGTPAIDTAANHFSVFTFHSHDNGTTVFGNLAGTHS